MTDLNGLKEVQLAALLHDVGKFGQRAGESGKHPEISRSFIDQLPLPEGIDQAIAAELVLRHHDMQEYPAHLRVSGLPRGSTRDLARIICEADNFSSAMDRERDEDGIKDAALISVLSEVDIGKGTSRSNVRYQYLRPAVFEPENLFPVAEVTKKELDDAYKSLWEHFKEECKNLPTSNFQAWYTSMDSLLKKYTSTALSAGYKSVPNIPLYDHLKTTAAIAHSLYKVRVEEPSTSVSVQQEKNFFLFIEGDLSGIQSFIFQMHNAQKAAKGAARRLRGRSFYLSLLAEAACRKILKALELPPTSLLWNAGGHFLILAPNTTKIKKRLEVLEKEIVRWIYRKHGNNLYMAIYWTEASPGEIKDFGKFKEEALGTKARRAKLQRFASIMRERDLFEAKGKVIPEGMHCPVCGQESRGDEPCPVCKKYEKIGSRLVKADCDCLIIGENLGRGLNILDVEFDFSTKDDLQEYLRSGGGTVKEAVFFNTPDFLPSYGGTTQLGYSFKYVGKGIPLRGERPVTFGEIAQFSFGPAKLGLLKADVDSLGTVFLSGLKDRKTGEKMASISRIHYLSTMLDTFFTGYLSKIMESLKVYQGLCHSCKEMPGVVEIKVVPENFEERKEGYSVYRFLKDDEVCEECSSKGISTPYITYSGGDDLLIVGPYDFIIEGAKVIRDEFRRFTGQNPNLTLSAGIAVTDMKFPMPKGTMAADNMLEMSKGHIYRTIGEKAPKDSVTIFGETVVWDSTDYIGNEIVGFDQLMELGRHLEEDVRDGKVSKGFVYLLLELWYSTFAGIRDDELERCRRTRKSYVPNLVYNLARNVKDKDTFAYYDDDKRLMNLMPWARVPVSWASLRTRKRGD